MTARGALLPLLLLGALACGSAAPGASAPPDGPLSMHGPSAAPTDAGETPIPAPSKTGPATLSEASSRAAAIVQALLDDPRIAHYIHPEAPGRLPLAFAPRGHLPDRPRLLSHGAPVRYVQEEGEALVLTALKVSPEEATASIEIPREGVTADALLALNDGWMVVRIDLREASSRRPAGSPAPGPSGLPPAWTDCSSDRCVIVSNACCDAWAVAERHSAAAMAEMERRRGPNGSEHCRRGCASTGTPICRSGRCELPPP